MQAEHPHGCTGEKRPLSIEFMALFQIDPARPPAPEDDLAALYRLREHLRARSPKLARWYLGGSTRAEALVHQAFDDRGPTAAFTAIFKEQIRRDHGAALSRGSGVWNGEEQADGASMVLFVNLVSGPSMMRFNTRIRSFLSHDNILATTLEMVDLWKPLCISVAPVFYEPTFPDRPGVGWMLYLPRALSREQVPDAHALVPVTKADADGAVRRAGTVIVSIGEATPFSDENPAHVERAHAIEACLVGQGLLPHFADFTPRQPAPAGVEPSA